MPSQPRLSFALISAGKLIPEIRELIKDLCYRNRQERERGEIELLHLRLTVADKFRHDGAKPETIPEKHP